MRRHTRSLATGGLAIAVIVMVSSHAARERLGGVPTVRGLSSREARMAAPRLLRGPRGLRAASLVARGASGDTCEVGAAEKAVASSWNGMKELADVAERLSRADLSSPEDIADLVRRNEKVLNLLQEVDTEINFALGCIMPEGVPSATAGEPRVVYREGVGASQGGVPKRGDNEERQIEELLKMRTMLKQELLPVAEQIESLRDHLPGKYRDSTRQSTNYWFPASFSSKLPNNELKGVELFEKPWVLYRDAQGNVGCIKDQCAHRACPLSLGKVVDGLVECPYHGWQFDSQGDCKKMPSTRMCKGIGIDALPVVESDGLIWVWAGKTAPFPEEPPILGEKVEGGGVEAELETEIALDHALVSSSLESLAREPPLHFERLKDELPLPDQISYHAKKWLAGDLTPVLQAQGYLPESSGVMVSHLSIAGRANPTGDQNTAMSAGGLAAGLAAEGKSEGGGRMYQLHAAVPIRPGRTRLLYRMSVDTNGLGLANLLPVSRNLWANLATRCLEHGVQMVEGKK
mmetsp:Transcript_6896/g.13523  ORF Transcript_6896/g.13523 Transcript_6896/m.13523 type:complete len:518 (-) Transcript_6896:365-1918(-)